MKFKIREIKLANNRISVMLDKHSNGVRTQERLGIIYADVPKNTIEREDKKEKKLTVKKIVAKMELEGVYGNYSLNKDFNHKADFFEYCQEYIDRKATKISVKTHDAVLKRLKAWTKKEKLPCGSITGSMLIKFKDYLDSELNGVTPSNYFKKLGSIFKEATSERYFQKNPIEGINNSKGKCAAKDSLTTAEIKQLADTPCRNSVVKKAFLYCCYTGIRFCDTVNLKWENVKEDHIDFTQLKTDDRQITPLHEDAIALMGQKKNGTDEVFNLPSHTGCLKILRTWAKDAEVNKRLSWHVSRVSFASILLSKGVDMYTVSKLLGHKSIIQTQTYLRIVEAQRQDAVKKLPSIF